ncbi:MAG: Rpn family recombination-promoting nuclease/putative transposase [Myxococcota bacterium]
MAFQVQSHDQLVKAVMQHEQAYIPFFQWALPGEVRELVDTSRLKPAPSEFVDPHQKLIADVVFRAPLRSGNGYAVLPLEHESSAKRMTPWRVLQYNTRAITAELAQNAGNLPFIWPLILHSGASPYNQPTTLSALFPSQTQTLADRVLTTNFQLVDLCRLTDENLEQAGGMASPFLLVMKHIHGANIAPLVSRLEPRLRDMGRTEPGGHFTWSLFSYILNRGRTDKWDAILRSGKACVRPQDREELTMIAGTLEHKGMQQGELKKAVEIARNLLGKGMPVATIAEVTHLPQQQIQELCGSNGAPRKG